jgi:hypothetical protein
VPYSRTAVPDLFRHSHESIDKKCTELEQGLRFENMYVTGRKVRQHYITAGYTYDHQSTVSKRVNKEGGKGTKKDKISRAREMVAFVSGKRVNFLFT